jgi:hypothetical protein
MLWQDWVFTVGELVFSIALIPSLVSKYDKPDRWTCGITTMVLWVFVPAYWSLELDFATWSGVLAATLWTILWIQKREANNE